MAQPLPQSLAGLQHIRHGEVRPGDVIVIMGRPVAWADFLAGQDVNEVQAGIYRLVPITREFK